jgi:glycosyltransferase involved in cell wall biosynthesis
MKFDEKPRSIAMLSESSGLGGAEMLIVLLGSELVSRGHKVTVYSPTRGDQWLAGASIRAGLHHRPLAIQRPYDVRCLLDLASELRREEVDVVHGHMFIGAVYGAAAGRLSGVPSVLTLHSGNEELEVRRRRFAMKVALRLSSRCTVVSQMMRSDVARVLNEPIDRFKLVYNGVPRDTGFSDFSRAAVSIPNDAFVVVSVGSCCRRKNHISLIRACAAMAPSTNWYLVIAGREDDAWDEMQSAVALLPEPHRVKLLGQRDDVSSVLAIGDVFAMPSLWEGTPLAMIEAMFAGLPIVASAVGGIPEVVEVGRNGYLVAPLDIPAFSEALERLSLDVSQRRIMGAASMGIASQRFTIKSMADQYEALYAEAISS